MGNLNVVIIGASGAIGSALVNYYAHDSTNNVYAMSRVATKQTLDNVHRLSIDICDEKNIEKVAFHVSGEQKLDVVIVATGLLHDETISPEKSLKAISTESFEKTLLINTIGPALIAKYFIPLMKRQKKSVFAALSARVGSVSDNHLGGWYSYRCSKAALNMFIKTASIEIARSHKFSAVIALHPGTVDSPLSEPFQKQVPDGKLFTPDFSASKLAKVIDFVDQSHSGKIFAWDGKEILP